jgi:hypothetical protein
MVTQINTQIEKPRGYIFAKGMSWLFLIVSLVLLINIFLRAEINPPDPQDSKTFKYYYLYLIIYGLSFIFWGIALRLNNETRLHLVLMACTFGISLYIAEFFFFFYGLPPSRSMIALKGEFPFDTRSQFDVIQSLRKDGIDAVPPLFHSNFYDSRPISENSGISLLPLNISVGGKTVVYCNEGGEFMIYKSDRYGFNNPDSEWQGKSTQWVLTGDSFVHGACVKPGEDISSQIRQQSGETALNLGSGDGGPLVELARLKEYAESRAPKRVIWVYYEGNDLTTDLNRSRHTALINYLREGFSQNLINRTAETDSILNKYLISAEEKELERIEKFKKIEEEKLLHYSKKIIKLSHLRARVRMFLDIFYDYPVIVDYLFIEILKKARDRVSNWGGQLYFVYLPEYRRYKSSTNHEKHKKRDEVLKVVSSLGIPIIDIHKEVFLNHPDPISLFPLRINGHYNSEGYKIVASAIIKGVDSNN